MTESETDLARRLLKEVLDGTNKWTPDMRLRIATVSQAYASLAIADELRRSNDSRESFYTEVLDLLVRVTEDPFEGPSGAGATAQVVEKEGP
jgi:hypothetical protein